jgi:hypothetical protein
VISPVGISRCRMIAKLRVLYPRRPLTRWMKYFLPCGDWIMMRRQLLTLKRLTEQNVKIQNIFKETP